MRSSVSAIPSVRFTLLLLFLVCCDIFQHGLSPPVSPSQILNSLPPECASRSAHVTSLLINLQGLPTAFRMKSRMKASSLTFEALLLGPARGPTSPATTKLPPNTPCTLQHPCLSRSCGSTCLGHVLLWPPT